MGSSNTGLTNSSTSPSASESDGSTSDTAPDTTPNQNDADYCPFSIGEKVLAFHGDSFYEAKVLRIMGYLNKWEFYVHYIGWNKNWDEWVDPDRLLAYTEENVLKHEENVLKRPVVSKKQELYKGMKLASPSDFKARSTNVVVRGKKRKKDDQLFQEDIHLTKGLYAKIKVPPKLRKHLVDDCELVTRMGKLVKLPRSPTVNDILDKYLRHKERVDNLLAESVQEIMKGLQSYFDKALPVMLLYKSERRQYEEAIADDVCPSKVYGAEHLLRLFVKLPELLYYAGIEEETFIELILKFNDFLKWLRTNQRSFFHFSSYYRPEHIETSTNERDN